MSNSQSNSTTGTSTVWQIVGRLITAAIVLAITAFVLTIMDYLIIKFTGLHASPFGKGFVGFALAAIILYFTQYFVVGYSISWMAAIIGALIYGVVDYFIPGNQQM